MDQSLTYSVAVLFATMIVVVVATLIITVCCRLGRSIACRVACSVQRGTGPRDLAHLVWRGVCLASFVTFGMKGMFPFILRHNLSGYAFLLFTLSTAGIGWWADRAGERKEQGAS